MAGARKTGVGTNGAPERDVKREDRGRNGGGRRGEAHNAPGHGGWTDSICSWLSRNGWRGRERRGRRGVEGQQVEEDGSKFAKKRRILRGSPRKSNSRSKLWPFVSCRHYAACRKPEINKLTGGGNDVIRQDDD